MAVRAPHDPENEENEDSSSESEPDSSEESDTVENACLIESLINDLLEQDQDDTAEIDALWLKKLAVQASERKLRAHNARQRVLLSDFRGLVGRMKAFLRRAREERQREGFSRRGGCHRAPP